MMRKLRIFLLFTLVLGCQDALVEKPDNLIPPGKMSDILFDLAVMEAIDNTYRGQLERNGIEPLSYVFEKHRVDSLQFAKSDFYYASRPAVYERIYQEVADRLAQQRDSVGEVIGQRNKEGREGLIDEQENDSL
ncbi:DUF4296 domain-containing protein [Robiginitalea sp. SC105]|uniref:DUF4296 domain-containing protein n=1 Tax=Robiginitalea sp. SC105 TaxID=2762332 RepID=UPI00163B5604|nr:DUF4296 domain-containing protein [Robiginitalea sp. SC105]MBC2837907.1 DUF4296 domain-containing protein [Robiginitalea sp. SC105]